MAKRLSGLIEKYAGSLPKGPVLEIGCGTGHLTEELVRLFPSTHLEITDLSPRMVSICQERVGSSDHISYYTASGEDIYVKERYALIASSMTFQWFFLLKKSLWNLYDALVDGGFLIFSLPDSKSYEEWSSFCDGDALLNTMTDVEELHDLEPIELTSELFVQNYPSPLEFFRHLRRLGANTSMKRNNGASWRLKSLIKEWTKGNNGELKVTTSVSFVVIQKERDVSCK